MKTLLVSLFAITSLFCQAQSNTTLLNGAYLAKEGNINKLWLFVDGYSSLINYEDQAYKSTNGGPFTFDGKTITIQIEYNDADSATVGTKKEIQITFDGENVKDSKGNIWVKQSGIKQDLDGLWRITGRKQGNNMSEIQRGDRKTIKLLVDGHFQWIAINPAVKGFYGTGGGHYTFKDGKYIEHIVFFSRDNSRVGATLSFEGKIQNGDWHHTGLSSKGDPIHEIWSRDN